MEDFEYDSESFLSVIQEALEDYGAVRQAQIHNEKVLVVTLTEGKRFVVVTREVTQLLGRDES